MRRFMQIAWVLLAVWVLLGLVTLGAKLIMHGEEVSSVRGRYGPGLQSTFVVFLMLLLGIPGILAMRRHYHTSGKSRNSRKKRRKRRRK